MGNPNDSALPTPESHDSATSVSQLRQLVEDFVQQRHWQRFHNPKNLAMSLAIEAGELMEHFQWLTLEQAAALKDDPDRKAQAGEEVADCLAYLLAIANVMQIDLSSTLATKMIANAKKYPVESAGEYGNDF